MNFTPFDFRLHGLLIHRTHYYKVRKAIGSDFPETLAGYLFQTLQHDISRMADEISIADIYDTLSIPYEHWRFSRQPE